MATLPTSILDLLAERQRGDARSGHQWIAHTLRDLGITHVYAVSGVPIEQTLGACARAGLRVIGVHHQQAAVLMAAAQNYSAGRLRAVVVVSPGPAATNAVTGALVAQENGWPVVILGGRTPLNMKDMGAFQELDAVPVFQPIAKSAGVVTTTAEIPGALAGACVVAEEGRPGAVYLELPQDVLNGKATGDPPQRRSPSPEFGSWHPDAIATVVDLLAAAERPLLVVGEDVRRSEPYAEMRELVERMQVPFVTSPMGRGFLPDDHPLCVNAVTHFAQSQADTVLALGARLDWAFRYGAEFPADAKLIQVDPDGSALGLNRAPQVGVVGDVKRVLIDMLRTSHAQTERRTSTAGRREWLRTLAGRGEERRLGLDELCADDRIPLSPYRMMREIREFLPRDAICVLDGNVSMAIGQLVLPAYLPATRFTAGPTGCMGVGIPFGIGAKIDHPDRPVVVICGDFAFGLSAMELETAVRHRIPVIVVVANNQGMSGGLKQKAFYPEDYPERVTMFQPGIRYEQIVEAFGGYGESVGDPAQLRPALERAAAAGVAACINVCVEPYTPYPLV